MRPLGALLASALLLAGACRHGRDHGDGSAGTTAKPESGASDNAGHAALEVATDHGVVRGVAAGASIAFRGLPYAAPPVAALRFSAPADAAKWTAPRDASSWGACCPQLADDKLEGQEDCLTLNVWTPATKAGPRPVLVFLHGGSNVEGCSARESHGQRSYDGDLLSGARGVVVVTLNYRLGVLGFLTHEALGQKSSNLGLRDQLAALEWVHKNIAAFGGDPARVLLFGESAGATDTCALMASPRAKGLFSRALLESQACPRSDSAAAKIRGAQLAAKLGCDGKDAAACLRKLPVEQLVRGATQLDGGPLVDGEILVEDPLTALAKGAHNHMPVIIGDNSAETLLWARNVSIDDEIALRAHTEDALGKAAADQILARYPVAQYGDPKQAFIAASTDAEFICPARQVARALAKSQREPVYRYLFTHALQTRRRAPDHGAMHGIELLFVFGHLNPSGYRPTDGEEALSSALQDYWTRFAATGDPNGADATPWLRYDAAADDYLVLDEKREMKSGLSSANCDFWDALKR